MTNFNDNPDNPETPWTFATGEREGIPMLLRVLTDPPSEAMQAELPTLVLIQWPFESEDGRMPEEHELAQMVAFEEAMVDGMEMGGWGVCVAVLTFGGTREWRCFAPDGERFEEGINEALVGQPVYPLKFAVFEDPAWMALREVQDAIG